MQCIMMPTSARPVPCLSCRMGISRAPMQVLSPDPSLFTLEFFDQLLCLSRGLELQFLLEAAIVGSTTLDNSIATFNIRVPRFHFVGCPHFLRSLYFVLVRLCLLPPDIVRFVELVCEVSVKVGCCRNGSSRMRPDVIPRKSRAKVDWLRDGLNRTRSEIIHNELRSVVFESEWMTRAIVTHLLQYSLPDRDLL